MGAYASTEASVAPRNDMYTKAAPVWLEPHWNVWSAGYGGSSRTSGDPVVGSSTTNSRVYGAVGGADYLVSSDTRVGFALGGAGTNYSLDGGFGGGRSDSFQAAVYGQHDFGPAYIMGALAYAWEDITTDRTVTVAGVDTLEARFQANVFAVRGEGGWRVATSLGGITPYTALQATALYLPSYGEVATSGSDQFALSYGSEDVTAVRSELGSRLDKTFVVADGLFTLRGRLAWAHDYDNTQAINATFQTLPGASFTVNGAAPAPDDALISAGAEMNWGNGVTLGGTFEGEFSRNSESYAGKGVVRYQW
jgi:uncharacterized protein with beta-barrel porin domain